MRLVRCLIVIAVAALLASGCSGRAAETRLPQDRLVVPGESVGGVRLGELRMNVEKKFGQGVSRRRGVTSYFGGRLVVVYSYHDRLNNWVAGIETTWSGFHTRSGIHVGSRQAALRSLHVSSSTTNALA